MHGPQPVRPSSVPLPTNSCPWPGSGGGTLIPGLSPDAHFRALVCPPVETQVNPPEPQARLEAVGREGEWSETMRFMSHRLLDWGPLPGWRAATVPAPQEAPPPPHSVQLYLQGTHHPEHLLGAHCTRDSGDKGGSQGLWPQETPRGLSLWVCLGDPGGQTEAQRPARTQSCPCHFPEQLRLHLPYVGSHARFCSIKRHSIRCS